MIKNKEELTNKIKLIEETERHKIEIENNKNKENKELKKELKKIKKKLNNYENTTNNINKGVINNITNNITNNIIQINPFGKEDLSHITDDQYKKFMKNVFPGFINFISSIHFNDLAPSNHNVYISNLNSKYAYINKDNKWIAENKDKIVDTIIRKKSLLLDKKYDELEEKNAIDDALTEAHMHFNMMLRKNDKEAIENMFEDITLLLYNNRDKIDKINNQLKDIKDIKK
jgi:hypothetical protein